MWKIRTICWQRGQTGGIRKIIPPLPPPRRAASGLQCPGPIQSSPGPSQDIRSWLGSEKEKEREFPPADKGWERCPPCLWDHQAPMQGAVLSAIQARFGRCEDQAGVPSPPWLLARCHFMMVPLFADWFAKEELGEDQVFGCPCSLGGCSPS